MRPAVRSTALVLLCAAVCCAGAALADEPNPFATPQHDVDVLYAMPVPAPVGTEAGSAPTAVTQRLRVQAATGRQRVDPPSSGAFMLTDARDGRMMVVEPSLHLATILPGGTGPVAPPGSRATGDYRKVGPSMVAGNGCIDWRTRDLAGHESVVCLTDDGVLLRIVQAGQIRAQAISVDRTPQPDSVFAVPAGFRIVQAPRSAD